MTTPARDALAEKLEQWCGDCAIVPDCEQCRFVGQEAAKDVLANPDLTVAALLEADPENRTLMLAAVAPLTDDDLRAVGMQRVGGIDWCSTHDEMDDEREDEGCRDAVYDGADPSTCRTHPVFVSPRPFVLPRPVEGETP